MILEQNEERLLSRSRHGRNRPDSIFVKPPGSVTMTASAEEHCKKHLENRNKGLGIRLGVKTTGCSGLAYTLEFFDEIDFSDYTYECGDITVVVDPKSHIYLDGTQLDYVKEGLNEGFVFKNPNVGAECGCGESFTV